MSITDTESKLAGCLQRPFSEVARLAREANGRYHVYPLMMGNKKRWIEAPDAELKTAQRTLLDKLLYRLEPTRWAHGFVKGRSIISNASEHCGREWVVNIDVKDFFPSITRERVIMAIGELFPDPMESELLADLVSRRGRLPQGAPTSPHLANLVVRKMDMQLAEMARSAGWNYTRYADDMSFSGDASPRNIVTASQEIVQGHGFRISSGKTSVAGQHQRQTVTGLTVNEKVSLPKDKRRRLRAMLHNVKGESVDAETTSSRLCEINGHLAFLAMICPSQFESARQELAEIAETPGLLNK